MSCSIFVHLIRCFCTVCVIFISYLVFCFFCFLSVVVCFFFFFSSRRRHTRCLSDWSSDVCSSDLLISALSNILDNAEAFAAKQEAETGRTAVVRVRVREEKGAVKVEITDNGGGIDPKALAVNLFTGRPRLFDLNVSRREGGTGLGLTEAWYAVRDAGGEIEVRSEKGEGTTFVVTLPAVETS